MLLEERRACAGCRARLADVLQALPPTELKACLWDRLDEHAQNALRCTCRGLQQLAQEGLVTHVALRFGAGHPPQYQLRRLAWCTERYSALQSLSMSGFHPTPQNVQLLKVALQRLPSSTQIRTLELKLQPRLMDASVAPVSTHQVGEPSEDLTALCAVLGSLAASLTSLCLGIDEVSVSEEAALAAAIHSLPQLTRLCFDRLAFTEDVTDESELYSAGEVLFAAVGALPSLRSLTIRSGLPDCLCLTPGGMRALVAPPALPSFLPPLPAPALTWQPPHSPNAALLLLAGPTAADSPGAADPQHAAMVSTGSAQPSGATSAVGAPAHGCAAAAATSTPSVALLQLESLTLHDCLTSEEGVFGPVARALASGAAAPHLHELAVLVTGSGTLCVDGDRLVSELCSAGMCRRLGARLRSLRLSGCNVTCVGAQRLAAADALPALAVLSELHLADNHIGAAGMAALEAAVADMRRRSASSLPVVELTPQRSPGALLAL